MNCPQCQDIMHKNFAPLSLEEYYYCRNCKQELKEMSPPVSTLKNTFNIHSSFMSLVTPDHDTHQNALLLHTPMYINGCVLNFVIPLTRSSSLITLADWIPYNTPSSNDSFYGVNRSLDALRLAGCRLSPNSSSTIHEALNLLNGLINREGGRADACFLPDKYYKALERELDPLCAYAHTPCAPLYGIVLHTSFGRLQVYRDFANTTDLGYVLDLGKWFYNDPNKILYCTWVGANGVVNLRDTTP